uniref:Uncharacterized protein n=1 Tax=Romanomermis culicivorax TaxID=13658 RepID=A0A915JJV2_ROMCU
MIFPMESVGKFSSIEFCNARSCRMIRHDNIHRRVRPVYCRVSMHPPHDGLPFRQSLSQATPDDYALFYSNPQRMSWDTLQISKILKNLCNKTMTNCGTAVTFGVSFIKYFFDQKQEEHTIVGYQLRDFD